MYVYIRSHFGSRSNPARHVTGWVGEASSRWLKVLSLLLLHPPWVLTAGDYGGAPLWWWSQQNSGKKNATEAFSNML